MAKGLNVVRVDGETIGQLYNTVIFKTRGDSIILDSGGWYTAHTKKCMNRLLPDGYHVYQENFVWYITTPQGVMEFKDGMRLNINEQSLVRDVSRVLSEPEVS